jgi:hypothetical protein
MFGRRDVHPGVAAARLDGRRVLLYNMRKLLSAPVLRMPPGAAFELPGHDEHYAAWAITEARLPCTWKLRRGARA